jgi:hypothetical protein
VGVVVAVGGVLAAVTVLVAGWGRLFSPLAYQQERGLHVEAVLATPAMVGWGVDDGPWRISYADSRAFEVTGPVTSALLAASTVLTLLLALGWLACAVRVLRAGRLSPDGLVWLSLAAVTAFVVSAKVFSPQYLLWLLPLAAVALVLVPDRAVTRWTVGLLLVTALTHLVYPLTYRGLVEHDTLSAVAVPALAVRNLLLVALLVIAGREAWSAPGTEPTAAEQQQRAVPD